MFVGPPGEELRVHGKHLVAQARDQAALSAHELLREGLPALGSRKFQPGQQQDFAGRTFSSFEPSFTPEM